MIGTITTHYWTVNPHWLTWQNGIYKLQGREVLRIVYPNQISGQYGECLYTDEEMPKEIVEKAKLARQWLVFTQNIGDDLRYFTSEACTADDDYLLTR